MIRKTVKDNFNIYYDSVELVINTPKGVIREEAFGQKSGMILEAKFETLKVFLLQTDSTYKEYTSDCFSYTKNNTEYLVRFTGFVSLTQESQGALKLVRQTLLK